MKGQINSACQAFGNFLRIRLFILCKIPELELYNHFLKNRLYLIFESRKTKNLLINSENTLELKYFKTLHYSAQMPELLYRKEPRGCPIAVSSPLAPASLQKMNGLFLPVLFRVTDLRLNSF